MDFKNCVHPPCIAQLLVRFFYTWLTATAVSSSSLPSSMLNVECESFCTLFVEMNEFPIFGLIQFIFCSSQLLSLAFFGPSRNIIFCLIRRMWIWCPIDINKKKALKLKNFTHNFFFLRSQQHWMSASRQAY
jgi:hypothetical protein